MAATSNLRGELEEVVRVNDYASFYDTLDGDGTMGSVIGYGEIYSAA